MEIEGAKDQALVDTLDGIYNLKTLNLSLEEDGFKVELQEDLFEQLFSVQKDLNNRTNLNHEQMFVVNHLESEPLSFRPNFSFNLIFLQKIVASTNEDNFGKLILGLLNVLFIWFNKCVLDLHPIFIPFRDYLLWLPVFLFRKITQILFVSRKRLKKFKAPLCDMSSLKKRIYESLDDFSCFPMYDPIIQES